MAKPNKPLGKSQPRSTAGRNQPQPEPIQRSAQPARAQQPSNEAVDWDGVLDSLATSGGGPFYFPKGTRTRLRLVCLEEDVRYFYAGAQTSYKGRPKTKYVVFANVLASEGGSKGPLDEKWKSKIVPVVITKTVLQGIINLLAEGYELFDETQGYGVTILRSGSGTDTDYNVTPSPAPVKLDFSKLEMPEKTLPDYAEDLTNRGERDGASKPEGEGDW